MRADRLLSIMMLLQHRGRMTAAELAGELEVSTRTVERDFDALSGAGVPVYAERGRHGGYALLPGYSTDLTGLTHDEALALLVAGSRASSESTGMGPALASAMRKVVAALPQPHRTAATSDAERVLVRQEGWLPVGEPEPEVEHLAAVQRAVFAGRRLRIRYQAECQEPRWRTVDPVGLVSARGRWYLLATREGAERTYRLSRMREVQELTELADRPEGVDLERAWQERRARFFAARTVRVRLRLLAGRRATLAGAARGIITEVADREDGWLLLDVTFADVMYAQSVLWSLGADAEALEPPELRTALAERAQAAAARYATER
ncbi:helix-turn-helix transcriptional regulator [Pseudonocardia sp. TRM90224]|uniref:helix-turn-helix transcriptional regulator n=1 Tax=Pseudonocardia sp. TRM90224 TaxID=2812678 RepID=UPI001E43EC2B|nr:YafY family protein [Pseudonocardia sp. TRM90224]